MTQTTSRTPLAPSPGAPDSTADELGPDRSVTPARTGHGSARPVRAAASAGLVLLATGVVLANPTLVLIGLGATATAVAARRVPFDLAVPAGALGLLLLASGAGVLAGLTGVDLSSRPGLLAAAYVVASAAVLTDAWRRPASTPPSAVRGAGCLAFVPAGVALGTGLLQSVSTAVARSWAFWGTDIEHHMAMVSQLQHHGALDYGVSSYPRGLHLLAALGSVPAAPLDDPAALLGYDLRLVAALSWLSLALMLWTGTAVCLYAGRRLGLRRGIPEAAAVVLGCGALLTNTFLETFVYMGAAPSLLAVVALWALPLAALAVPHLLRGALEVAVVGALATAAMANLWQALVLAPVVAVAVCLTLEARPRRWWPPARRVAGDLRRGAAALLLIAAAGALAAAPVLQVQRAGGTGLAAAAGGLPDGPWRMLVPAVLLGLPVLVRLGGRAARLHAGTAIGLALVIVELLRGAGNGLDLGQYYPLKGAWFLTVFLSPALALAVTAGAAALMRRTGVVLARTGPAAFVLRCTLAALVGALALTLYLPWLMGTGSDTSDAWKAVTPAEARGDGGAVPSMSAQRYDIAARFGTGPRVAVPYYVGTSALFDSLSTRIVSELLTFQTGRPALPGDAQDLCAAITTVAGDDDAVVVSKLPVAQVERALVRDGCPGRAAVARLPGGIHNGETETTPH